MMAHEPRFDGSKIGPLLRGVQGRPTWPAQRHYHGLEYEAPAETALAHWDAAIVVDGVEELEAIKAVMPGTEPYC